MGSQWQSRSQKLPTTKAGSSEGLRSGGGGLVLWFTGLPGSGKSTLSRALAETLDRQDSRLVTIFDGDVVRTLLSQGAGFSRADRYDNVCRIGFVAGLVVRHGGIAVVAAVSPYRDARARARELVTEAGGDFCEIHMDTAFATCVARDPKGHYARALAGDMELFTGVDDPYEKPLAPEILIRSEHENIPSAIARIMGYLKERHLLRVFEQKTVG